MAYKSISIVGVLTALGALLYAPVYQRATVFGFTRPQSSITNLHGLEALHSIPDTTVCEDLHHHAPSNLIFTACQDDEEQLTRWFPALGRFRDEKNLKQGSLTVIDPSTLKARKLKLRNFSGPWVTHGIDVLESSADPSLLYIFAINHLPNPEHYSPASGTAASPNKARSQIEVFTHVIGSSYAEHVRSVRHELIRTPNDIYATSETSFYVSNDHFYREGHLRSIEDLLEQKLAPWSDVVYITFDAEPTKDAASNVIAKVALSGVHNPNGLGRSSSARPNDVMVVDCTGGLLSRTTRDGDALDGRLTVVEQLQFDSTLDNPVYFEDRWATSGNNASGFIMAGAARAVDIEENWDKLDRPLPTMAWLAQPPKGRSTKEGDPPLSEYEKKLIFQDSGMTPRNAATALIVGIDPAETGGKKQGWLFVTGFISKAVVAARIVL